MAEASDVYPAKAMAEESQLVHRTVRTGGLLLALGSLQFVAALVAVEMQYRSYSFSQNSILSLGGSSSPWAWVFNGSLVALGLLAGFGLLLAWSAFEERASRGLAFLFLLGGAVGTVGVGTFSEIPLSFAASAAIVSLYVAVVGVVVGLAILSTVMHRVDRWRASRPYTLATAIVVAIGAGLLGTGYQFGLGTGYLNWLIAVPALVWPIVEGGHIALLHRYAPGLIVKASSA